MGLDYDGVDDVALATITALDSGDWTMGAWVNADTAGEGDDGQFFEGATTGNASRQIFRIFDATRVIRGAQIFSTTNASVTTSSTISLATWSLVFMTFRASDATVRVYFGTLATAMAEGSYTSQVAGVGTRQTGGTQLRVGNNSGTTGTFDGRIAHAVVAAREWSLQEMEAYRHRGVPLNYASLRGFWPLFGGRATEPDLSGNVVNLAVTGAVAGPHPPLMPFVLGPAQLPYVVAAAPPPSVVPVRSLLGVGL